jgi:hypothetical protein
MNFQKIPHYINHGKKIFVSEPNLKFPVSIIPKFRIQFSTTQFVVIVSVLLNLVSMIIILQCFIILLSSILYIHLQ